MVTMQTGRQTSVAEARVVLWMAENAVEYYESAEPDADLGLAKSHLRNAKENQRWQHMEAWVRNAERAILAANQAVRDAIIERFDRRSRGLLNHSAETRDQYFDAPELRRLEEEVNCLRSWLAELRPAVAHYRSPKLFAHLLRLQANLGGYRECLVLRETLDREVERVLGMLRDSRGSFPRVESYELAEIESDLVALSQEVRGMELSAISDQYDSYRQSCKNHSARVEEWSRKAALAFTPPSDKHVPQRGRPSKSKKARGHGRHGRYR